MEIGKKMKLKRVAFKDNYTIGKLYLDGKFKGDTLEDKVRVLGAKGEGKIFGQTAIPAGKYKVIITYSARFKRDLPLLLNVPFFEGIRIHPGNTAEDTHGCLMVGINDVAGMIHHSKATFEELFKQIKDSKDLEIEII